MQYFLAVDIGASSGRHILAHMEDGRLAIEEIYRFPNGMIEKNGHLCWDADRLFEHIKSGLKKCKEIGKIPVSVAIDTWAVDYVLLDENHKMIGDAVGYRDGRTTGIDAEVYKKISEEKLYERTGIQKQNFNTIYQLTAYRQSFPQDFARAQTMLMIPEYFNFLLSGKMAAEYTNATTTQLVNAEAKDWDYELIDAMQFPRRIFQKIEMPGTVLGNLTQQLQEEVGFDCKVVLPATHDTGSAVMAVPTNEEDVIYISSGTWSLMGTELRKADCSKESRQHNFTNEGGYDYRFRYLKNIMGLWMIQSVRKELAPEMSFGELCEMASKEHIDSIVDCNDNRFLAPENMSIEVRKYCEETGQEIPVGIYQIASVIYNSLANTYAKTVAEIEMLTGKEYDSIHVIGGGANAVYLNELTAKATGKKVLAGPIEATAIGNLISQLISEGGFDNLAQARECVRLSFACKEY